MSWSAFVSRLEVEVVSSRPFGWEPSLSPRPRFTDCLYVKCTTGLYARLSSSFPRGDFPGSLLVAGEALFHSPFVPDAADQLHFSSLHLDGPSGVRSFELFYDPSLGGETLECYMRPRRDGTPPAAAREAARLLLAGVL